RNILTGFEEKPVMQHLVSMGVYVVEKSVLSIVPAGQPFGFDDLMHALIARGERVNVRPHDGYWLDLGRPDDYAQAVEEFEARRGDHLRQLVRLRDSRFAADRRGPSRAPAEPVQPEQDLRRGNRPLLRIAVRHSGGDRPAVQRVRRRPGRTLSDPDARAPGAR